MKKILIFFLNIILSVCCLVPTWITGNAQEARGAFSLKFALTSVGGQSIIAAGQGDVITVSFKIQRTDSNQNYITNGFQNYIHYDLSFFEFVEDSIVCELDGNATAKKQTSLTYGEIIQCQDMSKTYESDFVFCSFQLRVIGSEGSGTVYNGDVYAFDANFEEVNIVEQNLVVNISYCEHLHKTNVAAKPASCTEDGWEAYSYCEDCELFFDATGENLIANVPFVKGGHEYSETLFYDETSHWYECSVCGDEVKSEHSGGSPTCQSKAQCEVCGQEYGSSGSGSHGKTYVENKQSTTPWQDGYSGDVYCSECHELIEEGKVISRWDFSAWPWYILVLAIIFLPVTLLVLVL